MIRRMLVLGVVLGAALGVMAQRITPSNLFSASLLWSPDATHNLGATGASRPASLFLGSPAITAGSATGLTVVNTGETRRQVYKATVGTAGCTAAAVTCDITIATLPAKTIVWHVFADLTEAYACAATCTTATLTGSLGTSAGGQQFLANFDADAATGQFGDADAEVGTSATITTATKIGVGLYLPSWSSTTSVVFRLASGTGNLGTGAATNLNAGSVTFYLVTEVMP